MMGPWFQGDETASNMGVSKKRGTPKSSILIGFSIISHPFWGTNIFGNTHMAHMAIFGINSLNFWGVTQLRGG